MINRIKIKNFRSIIDTETTLEKITVLVGSNGAGKSNFIKSLNFLANTAQKGIENSINFVGGFNSIIPKKLNNKELSNCKISFDYDISIDTPKDFPTKTNLVTHKFEFQQSLDELYNIIDEKVTFREAFAIAHFLKYADKIKEKPIPKEFADVSITFLKRINKRLRFESKLDVQKPKNLRILLEWFGFGFIKDGINSIDQILDQLNIKENKKESKPQDPLINKQSFLDPEKVALLSFSPQARRFNLFVSKIRSYDFQLNVLRQEQTVSSNRELSYDGKFMPSVLRSLITTKNKDIERINETIQELNPYIEKIGYNSLKTGKEFIEFFENNIEDGVASWDTSDGTLRSLAILLAIESADRGTIIIEEPEQNLHPWAIKSLFDHIREAVRNKNVQVIISTHSQQVLECVKPSEIRIVSRSLEKGTQIKKLEEVLPNHSIEPGELGRLWVKGLLSGVPQFEE